MKKTFSCLLLLTLLVLFLSAQFALAQTSRQTTEECLAMARKLEASLPGLIATAKASIHTLVPDPAAYERVLPSMDKVIADKDGRNLKNYGGLSEAYLYAEQPAKAEQIRDSFISGAKKVLPKTDTFVAAINGDFAIYYFDKKDYKKAEPLFMSSIAEFEANPTPAMANNLISDYLCMSLIKDKSGDKESAGMYARKLVALSLKQQQGN